MELVPIGTTIADNNAGKTTILTTAAVRIHVNGEIVIITTTAGATIEETMIAGITFEMIAGTTFEVAETTLGKFARHEPAKESQLR